MKFKIARSLLDQTLNYVSKGLSTKTPMPVLTGIYIEVVKDSITFIATNKEISTKVILQASDDVIVIDPGIVVAPGRYLCDIVKKIDDGMLELSCYEDSNIKILSSTSDFTLAPYNKFNYPKINFDISESCISISSKEFKKIVRQTAFACGQSAARMIFTAVHFEINNTELSAIATDTYRLSKRVSVINDTNQKLQVNVPAHSLDELCKILPDTDQMVDIYPTSNLILFRFNNVYFMSRLIEDAYIKTEHLFRLDRVSSVKVDRQKFIQAVDRASLFATLDTSLCVKLTLRDSVFEIASASSDLGKVKVKLDLLDVQGSENFEISFTAKNLLDAAKAFDTNTITFIFTHEVKPGTIISDEDPELYEVLLAIRQF